MDLETKDRDAFESGGYLDTQSAQVAHGLTCPNPVPMATLLPPPFLQQRYGKRQTLPNPTAKPTHDMMKSIWRVQVSRSGKDSFAGPMGTTRGAVMALSSRVDSPEPLIGSALSGSATSEHSLPSVEKSTSSQAKINQSESPASC